MLCGEISACIMLHGEISAFILDSCIMELALGPFRPQSSQESFRTTFFRCQSKSGCSQGELRSRMAGPGQPKMVQEASEEPFGTQFASIWDPIWTQRPSPHKPADNCLHVS